jgi:hypothetical protein
LTAAQGGLEKTEKVRMMRRSRFWAKDRGRRRKGGKAARALAGTLTATDRCDRCGTRAYVRVVLPSRLELLFCAHHHRQ